MRNASARSAFPHVGRVLQNGRVLNTQLLDVALDGEKHVLRSGRVLKFGRV